MFIRQLIYFQRRSKIFIFISFLCLDDACAVYRYIFFVEKSIKCLRNRLVSFIFVPFTKWPRVRWTMRKLYPGQCENMILRTKNECRYLTPTFHSRKNSNHINGYWLNGLRRSEKIALLCANHLCVSKYNCTMLHLFDDLWLDKIIHKNIDRKGSHIWKSREQD